MQKLLSYKVGSVHAVGGLNIIDNYPYNSDYATIEALGWCCPASASESKHNKRKEKQLFCCDKFSGYLVFFEEIWRNENGIIRKGQSDLFYLDKEFKAHKNINCFNSRMREAFKLYSDGQVYSNIMHVFGIIGDVKKACGFTWRHRKPHIRGTNGDIKRDYEIATLNGASRQKLRCLCSSYFNQLEKDRQEIRKACEEHFKNLKRQLCEKREKAKAEREKILILRYIFNNYNRAELIKAEEWRTLDQLKRIEAYARSENNNCYYVGRILEKLQAGDLAGACWYC